MIRESKCCMASAPAMQRQQSGVGLIEVMVSVLVLSVGLLGIAAMQATALRNGQSSLERSQAVIQTYGILDAIRADRANAAAYSTGTMLCSAQTVDTGSSTEEQIAQEQVNQWLASMKVAMGQAGDTTTCGQVACVANTINGNTCTVTIQWDDSRATNSGTQQGSTTRTTTTVAAV